MACTPTAQLIERSSVGASGYIGYVDKIFVECNTGQFIVNTIHLTDHVITQGVLQPDLAAIPESWIIDANTPLLVYPNPFTSGVWVDCPEDYHSAYIDVFSGAGRLVKTFPLAYNPRYLDLSALAVGTYFILLHTDAKRSDPVKVVKQNINSQ